MKLEWRPVAPGDGPAISTSLTMAESDELRRLANGADVLEIGSAFGYSAIVMALAGASVISVDPHVWLESWPVMLANVEAYAVADRVLMWRMDSQTAMPTLGPAFDVVWIDGDHEAAAVTHDVEWARKLLRPTGTLICHDYGEETCPGVRAALDAWKPPPRLVDTMAVYGPDEW